MDYKSTPIVNRKSITNKQIPFIRSAFKTSTQNHTYFKSHIICNTFLENPVDIKTMAKDHITPSKHLSENRLNKKNESSVSMLQEFGVDINDVKHKVQELYRNESFIPSGKGNFGLNRLKSIQKLNKINFKEKGRNLPDVPDFSYKMSGNMNNEENINKTIEDGSNYLFIKQYNEIENKAPNKISGYIKNQENAFINKRRTLKHSKSRRKSFFETRPVIKFKNVYDSFDSCEEEKEYDYKDYIQKVYTFHSESSFVRFYSTNKDYIFFLMLIFYTSIMALYSRDLFLNIIVLITFFTFELILLIFYLLKYFLVSFNDPLLNKENYNIVTIFKKKLANNYIFSLADFVICFPSLSFCFFILKISAIEIVQVESLFALYCFVKVFIIAYIVKWIHFTSLYEVNANDDNSQKDVKEGVKKGPLLKIFLFFLLFTHIASCIWITIGKLKDGLDSWLYFYNMIDLPFFSIYVSSIYFTITTLFTIGYGDIVAKGILERIYIIIFLIVGLLLYSFVITIVSSILKSKNMKKILIEQRFETFNSIKREFKLNAKIAKSIEKGIIFYFKNWHGDKEEILNNLPTSLKISLQLKIYENIFKKIDSFNNINDNRFLIAFANKLKVSKLDKKEFLIQTNHKIEEMYFVIQGSFIIKYQINYETCLLSRICEGKHYGNIMMFTYERSPFDFEVDTESCTIVTLTKKDFSELKNEFESVMISFIKESYTVQYFVETKKMMASDYYSKYFSLTGFEETFKNKINEIILKDEEIENLKRTQSTKVKTKKIFFNTELNKDLVEKSNTVSKDQSRLDKVTALNYFQKFNIKSSKEKDNSKKTLSTLKTKSKNNSIMKRHTLKNVLKNLSMKGNKEKERFGSFVNTELFKSKKENKKYKNPFNLGNYRNSVLIKRFKEDCSSFNFSLIYISDNENNTQGNQTFSKGHISESELNNFNFSQDMSFDYSFSKDKLNNKIIEKSYAKFDTIKNEIVCQLNDLKRSNVQSEHTLRKINPSRFSKRNMTRKSKNRNIRFRRSISYQSSILPDIYKRMKSSLEIIKQNSLFNKTKTNKDSSSTVNKKPLVLEVATQFNIMYANQVLQLNNTYDQKSNSKIGNNIFKHILQNQINSNNIVVTKKEQFLNEMSNIISSKINMEKTDAVEGYLYNFIQRGKSIRKNNQKKSSKSKDKMT